MAKFHDDWCVLPHGPLNEVEPGLLTVVGQIPMPLGNFPRRMTVVEIGLGRTAIFSPIPLRGSAMRQLEDLGRPAYLIVPNGSHRLDLRPFHARYPSAKIVTAPGAKARVGESVEGVQTRASLGRRAKLVTLAGCEERELAMLVRGKNGLTLLTNDVIGNVGHPQGIGARIMARLMGFGPTPRITRPARWFFIQDAAALAAQLRQWAAMSDLQRIIPSHGDVIDRPARLLGRLAAGLDPV